MSSAHSVQRGDLVGLEILEFEIILKKGKTSRPALI